jgi:hypothetical protein
VVKKVGKSSSFVALILHLVLGGGYFYLTMFMGGGTNKTAEEDRKPRAWLLFW